MKLPESVHEAIVMDQARAYSAAAIVKRHKPIPFAVRVRISPRAGDAFKLIRNGKTIWIEIDLVQSPWVFYQKWPEENPLRQNCKVKLGAWRDCLAGVTIEELP